MNIDVYELRSRHANKRRRGDSLERGERRYHELVREGLFLYCIVFILHPLLRAVGNIADITSDIA
jgi:hypothetical protein